jgi:hypothetical protein
MNQFLILLIVVINYCVVFSSENQCTCTYAGQQYTCGAIRGGEICCKNEWFACEWCSTGGCFICPQCYTPCACKESPDSIKTIDYMITSDGIIYSNYVQSAIKINESYVRGPIVHSSELNIGSHVWWPVVEQPHTQSVRPGPWRPWQSTDYEALWPISEKMAVLEVEHHNVTSERDNCCWSSIKKNKYYLFFWMEAPNNIGSQLK